LFKCGLSTKKISYQVSGVPGCRASVKFRKCTGSSIGVNDAGELFDSLPPNVSSDLISAWVRAKQEVDRGSPQRRAAGHSCNLHRCNRCRKGCVKVGKIRAGGNGIVDCPLTPAVNSRTSFPS
jgi:hypothetical protein